MLKTAELIDAAQARSGIPSDYALAQRLGVTRQTVSHWRTGDTYPDINRAFALAELAGRPEALVLAELEHERAARAGKALDDLGVWRTRIDRLTAGALAVFLSAGLGVTFAPDASAMARVQAPMVTGSPTMPAAPLNTGLYIVHSS
jgi:DNA-binding XRE family transcriptional regulator